MTDRLHMTDREFKQAQNAEKLRNGKKCYDVLTTHASNKPEMSQYWPAWDYLNALHAKVIEQEAALIKYRTFFASMIELLPTEDEKMSFDPLMALIQSKK